MNPQILGQALFALYAHTQEAIAILDQNECVVDINPAFSRLFGYRRDEILGQKLGAYISQHNAAEEIFLQAGRVQRGKTVRMQTTRKHKSGRPLHVLAVGYPVLLAEKTYGICAVYTDFSFRDKLAKALQQAEQRYKEFFEIAPVGLYISTPTGRFMKANQNLATLLGYDSIAEVTDTIKNIGKEIYETASERDALLKGLEQNGQVNDFRTTFVKKDGELISVRLDVSKVHDEEGEFLYYAGCATQIPPKKDES